MQESSSQTEIKSFEEGTQTTSNKDSEVYIFIFLEYIYLILKVALLDCRIQISFVLVFFFITHFFSQ